jgi:5-methylcytosine-specific restriction protein A
MRIFDMQNRPSAAEYERGLTALGARVTADHRRLFRAHYNAPDRTATSEQLSELAEIRGGRPAVNSRYPKLGRALCDVLGILPELRPDDTRRWWSVWSIGWQASHGFVWQMAPAVAEALERLGWVEVRPAFSMAEEVTRAGVLVEGALRTITVNAYERSQEARLQCIEAHGARCAICDFSFGAVYGPAFEGFIHVHHLRPLSELGREYDVDPVNDLRPVCPNCHAVVHRRTPPYGVDEVRAFLRRHRSQVDGHERG